MYQTVWLPEIVLTFRTYTSFSSSSVPEADFDFFTEDVSGAGVLSKNRRSQQGKQAQRLIYQIVKKHKRTPFFGLFSATLHFVLVILLCLAVSAWTSTHANFETSPA